MKSITSLKSTMRRMAVAGALSAAALAAHADGTAPKAVLSGYTDGVAGASLMAGDYRAVIDQLGAHGLSYASDELSASTNLCVAYIMTRQWTAAHAVCDEAIRIARLEPHDSLLFAWKMHDFNVALAYSNRAVLDWLEARRERTASDLAHAQALSPDAQFVTQNTVALATADSASTATAAVASAR